MIAEETGDERILARGLYSLAMVDQKAGSPPGGGHEAPPVGRDLPPAESHRPADHRPLVAGRSCALARRVPPVGPVRGRGGRLAEASHEGFYELVALCFLANAHAGLGEWDLAFKFIDEVRQKSRERENKYGMARGLNTSGWLHRQLGDLRQAIELDREALDFSRSAKLANPEIYSTLNMAEDHLALDEIGTAREDPARGGGTSRGRGLFDSHLWKMADAELRSCSPACFLDREGLSSAPIPTSTRHSRSPSGPSPDASSPRDARIRGEIWLAAGRVEDAQAELRRALEAAEATGSPANHLGDRRRPRASARACPGSRRLATPTAGRSKRCKGRCRGFPAPSSRTPSSGPNRSPGSSRRQLASVSRFSRAEPRRRTPECIDFLDR